MADNVPASMTPPRVSPVSASEDAIALDAAHQIEAMPSDLHPAQKTARIQLIVLDAMRGHAQNKTVEQILKDHFYTGEPGQHEAIAAAAKLLCVHGHAQCQQDRNETLRGLAEFFRESVHLVWSNDEIASCLTDMIEPATSDTSTDRGGK